MSEEKIIRINKVLRQLNISLERAVDYLRDKGIGIEANPNTKISEEIYNILSDRFAGDKGKKEASKGVSEEIKKNKDALRFQREKIRWETSIGRRDAPKAGVGQGESGYFRT